LNESSEVNELSFLINLGILTFIAILLNFICLTQS
jgi:hypothetical protein